MVKKTDVEKAEIAIQRILEREDLMDWQKRHRLRQLKVFINDNLKLFPRPRPLPPRD